MTESHGYRFGATSAARLATVDERLQRVVNRALSISTVDMTVVCGYRSPAEQSALYAQGRTKPGRIVTNVDGVYRLSRHNHMPALAVDIAPYVSGRGIVWDDAMLWKRLETVMKQSAVECGVAVDWGGDWTSIIDMPHWQLSGSVDSLIPKPAHSAVPKVHM